MARAPPAQDQQRQVRHAHLGSRGACPCDPQRRGIRLAVMAMMRASVKSVRPMVLP
jgi:hypothetical protein